MSHRIPRGGGQLEGGPRGGGSSKGGPTGCVPREGWGPPHIKAKGRGGADYANVLSSSIPYYFQTK